MKNEKQPNPLTRSETNNTFASVLALWSSGLAAGAGGLLELARGAYVPAAVLGLVALGLFKTADIVGKKLD